MENSVILFDKDSHIATVLNNAEHIMKIPLNLLLNKYFIISLAISVRDNVKLKKYVREALKQCPIIDINLFDKMSEKM